jgi:tRNA U34 5-methylaminomethyl-2-thiouridine-forming methyltransferase MnmC
MDKASLKIVNTSDDSSTLFVPELNEHYHSCNGAIQESEHIFIDAGLKFVAQKLSTITILEIGFGTGLNALQTYRFCKVLPHLKIHYIGLELYPLSKHITESLNFFGSEPNNDRDVYNAMHALEWGKEGFINNRFTLQKVETDVTCGLGFKGINLVYFDAFAPQKQPEMWTPSLFADVCSSMNPGAVLVTYSAKGDVRRGLQSVGFSVERLPGPLGKREMLRATKI